ncbi:uncharacterized protein LOC104910094 isoform X8 [Meleagris gallopavo]|uniref:uncharacterized protein LOC104910094 isoform X8 n=1 Tax=Meleagris gallopavo TaxID=9103 RepID=UPI0012AC3B84|nr:uncharacterized protein LOC104910094 isoform X8 [Meleagris gallopavo]
MPILMDSVRIHIKPCWRRKPPATAMALARLLLTGCTVLSAFLVKPVSFMPVLDLQSVFSVEMIVTGRILPGKTQRWKRRQKQARQVLVMKLSTTASRKYDNKSPLFSFNCTAKISGFLQPCLAHVEAAGVSLTCLLDLDFLRLATRVWVGVCLELHSL